MKSNIKHLTLVTILGTAFAVQAGNPERVGQAGAAQLLINPFARNSGMAGANSAKVKGLESQFLNIAGIAYTRKTEIIFNRGNWLQGSGINVNSFGLTQGIGETGTIGFGVVAINSGNIDMTTEEQPEGELGTFNASYYNINLSYAKMFSNAIYGGINVKMINEQIPNASARGLAIDAGIQYHTGKYDNIHVGIALRNWGPKMRYNGDGLSRQVNVVSFSNTYQLTVSNRSSTFELPTQLNIGGAYDFLFARDSSNSTHRHRLSLNGTFSSNSFTYDNGLFGVEYAWREMLMARCGLYTEKGIFSNDSRRTIYTGPAFGFTFELPYNQKKSTFALDYSYRTTNPFSGVHTFGARLNL